VYGERGCLSKHLSTAIHTHARQEAQTFIIMVGKAEGRSGSGDDLHDRDSYPRAVGEEPQQQQQHRSSYSAAASSSSGLSAVAASAAAAAAITDDGHWPRSGQDEEAARRRSLPHLAEAAAAITSSAEAAHRRRSTSRLRAVTKTIPRQQRRRPLGLRQRRPFLRLLAITAACFAGMASFLSLLPRRWSGRSVGDTTNRGMLLSSTHLTADDSRKRLQQHDYDRNRKIEKWRNPEVGALRNNKSTASSNARDSEGEALACSCRTPVTQIEAQDGAKCCDRRILRAHKMGVVLIREMFPDVPSLIIDPSVLPANVSAVRREPDGAPATAHDYRHVVVTRPWYDSIISGFLYHKSGRECWLDQNGMPRSKNKTFEWESQLRLQPLQPPSRGRTLCSYLAEESEEDGMRAYVDFSVSGLYGGILPHRDLVERLEGGGTGDRKTLFVCFSELENPLTKQKTYEKVMNWLYPGVDDNDYGSDANEESAAAAAAAAGSSGAAGGHGTSRDETLRNRLRGLVEKIDREQFGGVAARATEVFGCAR